MARFIRAIHAFLDQKVEKIVDGPNKSGHDGFS
jgi:hypothetical protein